MRSTLLLVTMLVTMLVGCSSGADTAPSEPQPQPLPPPVVAAEAPPAPVVAPVDHTLRRTSISAIFRASDLSECVEFTITLEPPDPLPEVWPPASWDALSTREIIADAIRLERPCEEQFADHTVLGRCTVASMVDETDAATGEHFRASVTEHWYDVDTLHGDAHMLDCLQHHGDWWGMPRDSPEAHRMLLREASDRLSEQTRPRR